MTNIYVLFSVFFFSSRRRHTRSLRDWSSDVCSSDLPEREHERATRQKRCGSTAHGVAARRPGIHRSGTRDRKTTRLNSSHVETLYAVFCLKKKTRTPTSGSKWPDTPTAQAGSTSTTG